ncbi:MAG: ZIP family metal transporter [Candidatus Bathyarchaeia archaeon]|jgi:zinc and cadmium transporter|nr:ZIP family metal transporter [Candidatus Bathyarchaeota archaeon A05DMB-4]MDH7594945.1 ZIP family metal transporter [Candidatus Bathyarchaeota archaeon]
MEILLWILVSTFLVSLVSFVGVFFLALNEKFFKKLMLILVSFASGTLLGGAFFHLIPESLSPVEENVLLVLVSGIVVFFLLEKFLWRHCHERECPIHPFAYLNLVGDGIHNFIDGLIIAAGFLAPPSPNFSLGFITTLLVISHEIPQEIGDFGLLVFGGFTKKKALFYNFLSALVALLGALITYFFFPYIPNTAYLLAFAAGGFIYIATTDLIPELHKERGFVNSALQFVLLLAGLGLMFFLKE